MAMLGNVQNDESREKVSETSKVTSERLQVESSAFASAASSNVAVRAARVDSTDRLLLEENPNKHVLAPFLSNSDGAKYVKQQMSLGASKPTPDHRRRSQAGPIFLGGQYLRSAKNRAENAMTDATSASEASVQDGEHAFTPSQYFLFPPVRGETEAAGSSASPPKSGEIGKSTLFSDPSEAEASYNHAAEEKRNAAHDGMTDRLGRRRSYSTHSGTGEQFTLDNLRHRKETSSSRHKVHKRATVHMAHPLPFAGSKSPETAPNRRKTIQHHHHLRASVHAAQNGSSQIAEYAQQRVRSKAYSQVDDRRLVQRRLRVSYVANEFIVHLHGRRSIRTRPQANRVDKGRFQCIDIEWLQFIRQPFLKFQRMASIVRLLLRCLVNYRKISLVSHVSQMSFAMLSNDMVAARRYRDGLLFDPNDYRAVAERPLNDTMRNILSLVPEQRTDKQLKYALKGLRAAVEEFAEFPLGMQEALVRVAWLDEFQPKRVIIRQGHKAETFYFIVSGTALVTKNKINRFGEGYVETVNILKRGKSFGELAIIRHEERTNNVVSHTNLTLLTVSRKDFVEIFMHRMDGGEPEFMTFLRKLPEFKGYPLYKLPRNKPQLCAFTYFRVGVVICQDSNKSDVIVIVKSGFCRVMKKLNSTQPNIAGLRAAPSDGSYERISLDHTLGLKPRFGTQRPIVLTSPSSPVSLLTGPQLPTLIRRLTLPTLKNRSSSWEFPNVRHMTLRCDQSVDQGYVSAAEEHKKEIQQKYSKWQEEHPISRETMALLITGRDLESNESNEENKEEGQDQFNQHEASFQFSGQQQTTARDQHANENCESRRSSLQSNFRVHILKRNRASLADAWSTIKFPKKLSTASSQLPRLNEDDWPELMDSSQNRDDDDAPDKPVYIHVQTLGAKEVFGLLPLLFDQSEGATSVSLVSEGAECILINKDFFLKHFDDEFREHLIRNIQPYPPDESLQASMQVQANWDAYKFMTVHSHVTQRAKHKDIITPKAITTHAQNPTFKYLCS